MYRLLPLSLALSLLAACSTGGGDPTPVLADTEAYLDREVMVSIDDDADGVARMHVQEDFGLRAQDRIAQIGVSRLSIDDDRDVKQVAQLLSDDYRVRFAEPNYLAHTASTSSPDDPYRSYQWNLDQIDAQGAWAYGTGSGITVAVIDTGLAKGGPDGMGSTLSGYDFYNSDSDPTDGNGHGTFVSGTIAQKTDNGVGVAGVAPGVKILPVKVMSDQGYGDINAISNGIIWAADQGATVASMSLGSSSKSQTLEDACRYAYDKGVTLVAASGNEFARSVSYPAAYDTVIAVGASRYDGTRAGYSNTGSGLGLLAPGGDTSVDQNGDGYADGVLQETRENGKWSYTFWEGTSMATPHVSAVAALIQAQGVTDPAEVANILYSTAKDVGSAGFDTSTGYGLLNAGAAVAMAAGSGSTGDAGSGPSGSGSTGDAGSGSSGSGSSGDAGSSVDVTAPVISNVSGYTQSTRFTVQWVTDEAATSYVDFQDYGAYGNDTLTTAHTLSFTGQRGSTYAFDLQSTDAAGNTATSGSWQISL